MTTTHTSGAADLPEARLFTKKPVTIAAIQWTGKNLREVITFTDGPPDTRTTHAGLAWEAYTDLVARDGLKIYTLEGKMLASPGDWIIRGVKGEYYPCKPDIFEATYSPAALAAGQAVAPAEAMEVDNYPSLPKSTGDVVDWGIGSSSREVDWSDDAPPAGGKSLYTADQMRAYVDADRAARPAPPAMDGGEDAARWKHVEQSDDFAVCRLDDGAWREVFAPDDVIDAARAAQKEGS